VPAPAEFIGLIDCESLRWSECHSALFVAKQPARSCDWVGVVGTADFGATLNPAGIATGRGTIGVDTKSRTARIG
jgi:hypothetical protein